ncbi:hypothetical protein J6590_032578 [Homalodisca vitripennis]|nr:hypothetical protein J6590_032578 [Homalodisca vitripennis]
MLVYRAWVKLMDTGPFCQNHYLTDASPSLRTPSDRHSDCPVLWWSGLGMHQFSQGRRHNFQRFPKAGSTLPLPQTLPSLSSPTTPCPARIWSVMPASSIIVPNLSHSLIIPSCLYFLFKPLGFHVQQTNDVAVSDRHGSVLWAGSLFLHVAIEFSLTLISSPHLKFGECGRRMEYGKWMLGWGEDLPQLLEYILCCDEVVFHIGGFVNLYNRHYWAPRDTDPEMTVEKLETRPK